MQARANYHGFVGLKTELDNFADYVMLPHEVEQRLKDNQTYDALCAYPDNVAGGFNSAPLFAATDIEMDVSFNLVANLKTNRRPKNGLQLLACFFLPREYTAEDHVKFKTDEANGFGPGTCRVTSFKFTKKNGSNAWLAHKLLAVQNRAALYLKVLNPDGTVNPDVIIFFPDRATEATHKAVQYGEAFIFIRHDVKLTPELTQIILDNFNLLVKKSYGETNGLFDTTTHTAIKPGI